MADAPAIPAMEFDEDMFDWETRQESMPFLHHAIAGSSAGIMEHVSMFPIDTVKTRIQASQGQLGFRSAFRAVLQDKGPFGFIRGAHVIGFGCIPSHIGLFWIYEESMARLVDKQDLQPHRVAFCGAMAAVFHDGVLTPHDTVKQRLQLGRYTGALDCIRTVLRTEGPRAFYRSLPATMAMNVPYTATVTAANETLQQALGAGGESSALSTISGYFLCAGLSGGIAAAITSPLDVLKTRLQTQREFGFFGLIPSIFKREGLRGFFKGALPRVLLAAPAAGVSWGTYETVRLALQQRSDGNPENIKRAPTSERMARTPTIKVEVASDELFSREHNLTRTLTKTATAAIRNPASE